jgi:NADH dehydrogenase/NADH:ubiquinone oxidoreductase subunit G
VNTPVGQISTRDLGVYGAHDNVYFGRPEDGTLESEFSGNLVEICPMRRSSP